jgi:hypothetical protein
MTISYPLAFPTHTGAAGVEFRALNAVAQSRSPFTFESQTLIYPGQMWLVDVTLPPMRRAKAEIWVGWLLGLRGKAGTFLLGDPMCNTIRGTATSATITGAASSSSVTIAMTGTLVAGDLIQIGAGADATLHKVTVGRSGSGTLEIWPALRKARAAVAVTLTAPRGVFRLASNETAWSVNNIAHFGISFSAEEAV